MPGDPVERARARVLELHRDLLLDVVEAADGVVSQWDRDAALDRTAVVDPLERELDRRGILDRLPEVLADAVDAAGYELAAQPIPAPPYVVVTSEGPVLRATVPPGRLVIEIRVFDVERNPVRYRRLAEGPDAALGVTLVGRS